MLNVYKEENLNDLEVIYEDDSFKIRFKNFTAVLPKIMAEDLFERLQTVLDANP